MSGVQLLMADLCPHFKICKMPVFKFSVSLLLVLTSPHSPIRSQAVDIAGVLLSKVEGHDSCFKPLLKKVVHCREELQADPEFVQQVRT